MRLLSTLIRLVGLTCLLLIHRIEAQVPAAPAYELLVRSLGPSNTDIFVATSEGGEARALASHPALDYNPTFSVDGRSIVFTSHRSGSADVYRMQVDGSRLERLTDDAAFDDQGALSPDGRQLAFVSTRAGQADIWILDLPTRSARNLTRHASGEFRPTWSPDGRWIAFSSDRDPPRGSCPDTTAPGPGPFVTPQYTGIFVVRSDGTGLRRISRTDEHAASPEWSTDGARLAYHTTELDTVCAGGLMFGRGPSQIATVELESAEHQAVTSGAGLKLFPHWSNGVFSFVAAEGVKSTGSGTTLRGEFGRPDWSPDRRTLIFHRETDTRADRDRDMKAIPSSDPRFALRQVPGHASLSPDGSRVAFLSTNFGGETRNGVLMLAGVDGSNRRVIYEGPVTDDVSGPAWSPSGESIMFGLGGFFQRASIRTARLMSIRLDGTGLSSLTDGRTNDAMPSWSPDGKHVVFRQVSGGNRTLAILDVESGTSRQLATGSSYDTFPAWSPRGNWIVFTSKRDGDYEIYRIRTDGSGLERLTRSPGVDAHPSISPDGEWISFATGRQGFKDESVGLIVGMLPPPFQPHGEIAVMRIDGSDLRVLTDNSVEEGTTAWIPRARRE